MSDRIEQQLSGIEAACDRIRKAAACEDWAAVTAGNDALDRDLPTLFELVENSVADCDRRELDAICQRLESALAEYALALELTEKARDATSAEMSRIREGRAGTNRYLETAGAA